MFVYDAARIVKRIKDLAAFDTVRYAQKACSNLAILDLVRRHRRGGRRGERRRNSPRPGGGFRAGPGEPPEIFYTADIFDQETLDLVVEHDIPVNCGSPDMIDQLGERAPGREITLADQSRLRPRAQSEDEHRRRAVEARHLARAAGRLPGARRAASASRYRSAHAHRFRHRPEAPQPGLRRDGRSSLSGRPTLTSISAGGGLPTPYREEDQGSTSAGYFEPVGRHPPATCRASSATLSVWKSSRAAIWPPKAAACSPRSAPIKQMGDNLFYLVDAGFNTWHARSSTAPTIPMAVCYAQVEPVVRVTGSRGPAPRVVVGGPFCESGDIFTQAEGGFV